MTNTTSTPVKRAWTDIEPKLIAWLTAGGLLTVATIVYGYAFPSEPLPVWLAPVVTLVAGAIVGYLKKSTVAAVDTTGDHVAVGDAPVEPADAPDMSLPTDTTTPTV